ncbi:hypothetical protein [Methylobacterium radiotolerans]|uniref:Helix-turn-helix domain-containing protein n=1 Tax=Methylobacterium radiotolerans (strain ATCC 27329 / DSM 1819 / JCM 2831 / NBRC 15690 / NCIMB 10815 / 0-1) TaxID=426355 RepID=B1MAA7_METRJ|nr:hypothetical protein [Methylobacterium radiotolerans]ACB28432.1 hypothetical protein Mrad2831_6520 [Methylobacterium radiotolerans JCM 2831]GEN01736.1 hypothetical protein MRA01_62750 [Methylobacterium radiotolerans]
MSTPLASEPPILLGLAAVADFLGITERQARHLAGKGSLPVFKLRKSGLVAARPESLRAWLAAEEAAALAEEGERA